MKFTFKTAFFLTLIVLLLMSFKPVYAEEMEVLIVVPSTGQKFYSYAIMDENWRVSAPLRDIISALGDVDIQWEPDEQRVTAQTKEHWCECWIGENKATVDGDSVYLDTPPFVYYGRTYVPIRFIGESLGKQVEWNYGTRTITLR